MNRINKLRLLLNRDFSDNALVFSQADIFYLTGVNTSGLLIIKSDNAILYVPSVNYEEGKSRVYEGVEYREYRSKIPWQEVVSETKSHRILIDSSSISCGMYEEIKNMLMDIVFVNGLVSDLRVIKEADEIDLIRKACCITENILKGINVEQWKGRTEKDLAGYLENQAWKSGGEGSSFKPIVAAGANSACPHHIPGNDLIETGWLKIDYGIIYDGYCSDLTRTYILDKFNNGLNSEELLMALKNTQKEAALLLKPGVSCSDVYKVARQCLEKPGLAEYFIHGLGHGVGVEVHEKPYLKAGENKILSEGMVVTIEPGFYMPGIGGMRVEDVYTVTESGGEVLTGIYL